MKKLNIESYIRIIVGSLIFISAVLGYIYSKNWLFVTMFIGLNLFQFGFTGFCPLKSILKKLGIKE